MKRSILILAAALACAGCSQRQSPEGIQTPDAPTADVVRIGEAPGYTEVDRIVDAEIGVVCYVSNGYKAGGISCLKLEGH